MIWNLEVPVLGRTARASTAMIRIAIGYTVAISAAPSRLINAHHALSLEQYLPG
jgi:hypothetical protein